MYAAIGSNLKKGKGGLFLAPWVGSTPPAANDIGNKVGNCESITYGPEDVQSTEKYSSTQNNTPLLAKQVDRAGWRLVAQADEHVKENVVAFFAGTESTIALTEQTQTIVQLADVVVGRSYRMDYYNLTAVEVYKGSVLLTADTDYKLYAAQGVIEILGGAIGDGDDIEVDFDAAAVSYSRIAVGQTLNRFYKATYFADDSNTDGVARNDVIVIPKVALVLEGEYGLISEDFGTMTLAFSALDDSDNWPGRGLGWIERGAIST